ncbi:hypothetical protein BJ742DRAFT_826539 [Cladochytrium replicatum]|nr:hypothetical protein BJ742DRAFT_826539 [Cladochytrium replicatum]
MQFISDLIFLCSDYDGWTRIYSLPLILLCFVLGLLVLWMSSQLLPHRVRWIADTLLLLPVAVLSIIIWSLAFRDRV